VKITKPPGNKNQNATLSGSPGFIFFQKKMQKETWQTKIANVTLSMHPPHPTVPFGKMLPAAAGTSVEKYMGLMQAYRRSVEKYLAFVFSGIGGIEIGMLYI
jgi:hypothetical protein